MKQKIENKTPTNNESQAFDVILSVVLCALSNGNDSLPPSHRHLPSPSTVFCVSPLVMVEKPVMCKTDCRLERNIGRRRPVCALLSGGFAGSVLLCALLYSSLGWLLRSLYLFAALILGWSWVLCVLGEFPCSTNHLHVSPNPCRCLSRLHRWSLQKTR